jgi:hypothetical protein
MYFVHSNGSQQPKKKIKILEDNYTNYNTGLKSNEIKEMMNTSAPICISALVKDEKPKRA